MSDTTLRDLVLARLEKDTGPEDEWSALVLAALESREELDELLWSQRSKVWRDGAYLEGETGACTLAREWADGAELTGASTWAQLHGQPRTGPEALDWETPLEAYRPSLSCNELGSLLDEGPSKLYDALSKVLGLDALVDAQTALQQARSAPDKARNQKAAAQTVAGKSDQLATLPDHALRFHKEHGDGDCPLCGNKGAMNEEWHQTKAKEAETLRQAAKEATEAREALKEGGDRGPTPHRNRHRSPGQSGRGRP